MNAENPADAQFQNLERFWSSTDPRASELSFRELLPNAEALTGHDRHPLIDLHTYIARCETAQQKYSEAGSSLEAAARLLEEKGATYPVASRIRWLVEMGRLQVVQKTPSQARARFADAWTLAVNSGEDSLAAEIALLRAAVEPQKQQQEWVAQGIRVAEASPQADAKRWLGTLYASLGWKLFDLRQYDAALAALQKSLSHLKLDGSGREVFVGKWSIGKLLRTMGRAEEAFTIQNALLAELGANDPKDGRVFQELAECLQSLKRVPEAQVFFDLAYRELSSDPWVVDNQPEVLKRLKELGKSK